MVDHVVLTKSHQKLKDSNIELTKFNQFFCQPLAVTYFKLTHLA
jgi:hypothetical protein